MPAIACPFCGLVCDDLLLEESRVDSRGCAKAAAGFARAAGTREHRIAGRAASFDDAVAAAATLLAGAQQPLITGLGADIAGLRALLALADRTGAIVDRWQSAAQLSNLAVIQRAGALAATFGEIANRADVVLLLGRDPSREHPRLFERLLRNRTALYRSTAPWVSYLGPAALAPTDVPLGVAGAGRCGVAGRRHRRALRPDPRRARGGRRGRAAARGARHDRRETQGGALRRHPVGGCGLRAGEVQIAVALVLHILRFLTLTTRCVGLPLGGGDNAQGASQTMLWQAGWPGRISFATGTPEHDPWRFDAERLLAAREVDALALGRRAVADAAAIDRGADRGADRPRCDARSAAGRRDPRRRSGARPRRRGGARRHRHRAAADGGAAEHAAERRGGGDGDPRADRSAAMITKLAGGRVLDPANAINGEQRDLFIDDGRIVAAPGDGRVDRSYDMRGLVVMAGGIDIHSHVGGGKVNLARLLMPEDHRDVTVARGALTRSGGGQATPSSFATGYRYVEMGYTAAFEPAMVPSQRALTRISRWATCRSSTTAPT